MLPTCRILCIASSFTEYKRMSTLKRVLQTVKIIVGPSLFPDFSYIAASSFTIVLDYYYPCHGYYSQLFLEKGWLLQLATAIVCYSTNLCSCTGQNFNRHNKYQSFSKKLFGTHNSSKLFISALPLTCETLISNCSIFFLPYSKFPFCITPLCVSSISVQQNLQLELCQLLLQLMS